MGPIVVGVQPDQPDEVVQQAAQLATLLGCDLICTHEDVEVLLTQGLTGSAAALGGGLCLPVHTDLDETPTGQVDPALRDQIASALHPSGMT